MQASCAKSIYSGKLVGVGEAISKLLSVMMMMMMMVMMVMMMMMALIIIFSSMTIFKYVYASKANSECGVAMFAKDAATQCLLGRPAQDG